jgi:hypothetical protein
VGLEGPTDFSSIRRFPETLPEKELFVSIVLHCVAVSGVLTAGTMVSFESHSKSAAHVSWRVSYTLTALERADDLTEDKPNLVHD